MATCGTAAVRVAHAGAVARLRRRQPAARRGTCASAAAHVEDLSQPQRRSRSAGERLRDGAAWVRDGARFNLTLAQRLAADVLVASLLGLPEPVRRGAAADARRNAAGLCCSAFWLGDKARMASDARFYGDGFALLARDLQRDAPLLLSPGPHSERQRAARARIAADLRALVPFSLLLMNTFPWTIGLLEHPLVARGWLPRRWLLPSAFETERLSTVARARQHAKRAAAAAVTTK